MLFDTTYNQLERSSKGLYKEKGSKFISYAFIVKSEDKVKEIIIDIKKLEKNARHFCYAYIINPDKSIIKFNDDGEPNNSAGKPILNQIKSKELTNCIIVVVRYFGGTKLGITGLIRAYKNASLDAINNNEIRKIDITEIYKIIFPFQELNNVMKILKKYNAIILSHQSDIKSEIKCSIALRNSSLFFNEANKNHKIQIEYLKTKK